MLRSTHAPLQLTCGSVQLTVHVPPEQTSPGWQAPLFWHEVPHVAGLLRFVHTPPQLTVPIGQPLNSSLALGTPLWRTKNAAELQTELEALLKEQFGLRMQRATQQLTNTSKLKDVRRGIARVRTLMGQKAAAARVVPGKDKQGAMG